VHSQGILLVPTPRTNPAAYPAAHVGLRLGETFLTSLASQIGISHGDKYIRLWNELMTKTKIECAPFPNTSPSAMGSSGKQTYTLPSLKLEKLIKVIYNFPYADLRKVDRYVPRNVQECDHQASDKKIDADGYRNVALLFCESLEAIMRGDPSEACRQVCWQFWSDLLAFGIQSLISSTNHNHSS